MPLPATHVRMAAAVSPAFRPPSLEPFSYRCLRNGRCGGQLALGLYRCIWWCPHDVLYCWIDDPAM